MDHEDDNFEHEGSSSVESVEAAPILTGLAVADVEVEPGPNDVLLGRGKGNERHPGNVRLKAKIARTLPRFSSQRRGHKKHVINEVVEWVNSSGKFLTQRQKNDISVWVEANGSESFQKIAQAFRYRQRSSIPTESSPASPESSPAKPASRKRKASTRASVSKTNMSTSKRLSKRMLSAKQPLHASAILPETMDNSQPVLWQSTFGMQHHMITGSSNLAAARRHDHALQGTSAGIAVAAARRDNFQPSRFHNFDPAATRKESIAGCREASSPDSSFGEMSPLLGETLLSDKDILSAIGEWVPSLEMPHQWSV